MNAASAAKAGLAAFFASPLDDALFAGLVGRTVAAELGAVILIVGVAVAIGTWWL